MTLWLEDNLHSFVRSVSRDASLRCAGSTSRHNKESHLLQAAASPKGSSQRQGGLRLRARTLEPAAEAGTAAPLPPSCAHLAQLLGLCSSFPPYQGGINKGTCLN